MLSKIKSTSRDYRQNLLADIATIVRKEEGCLRLRKTVIVFADDIFGEIPVQVKYIKTFNQDANEFKISEDYTTLHLDNTELQTLVNAIKQQTK